MNVKNAEELEKSSICFNAINEVTNDIIDLNKLPITVYEILDE